MTDKKRPDRREKKNAPNSAGTRNEGADLKSEISCPHQNNALCLGCQVDAITAPYEAHFRLPFRERSHYAIQLAEAARETDLLTFLLHRHLEFGIMVDRARRGLIP